MSWLSNDWHRFVAWLHGVETPGSKSVASGAAGALQSGLTATEQALELIAMDAANAALALLPVVGPALTPTIDALIETIAAKVLTKHSAPGAAAAAIAANPLGAAAGPMARTAGGPVTMSAIPSPGS